MYNAAIRADALDRIRAGQSLRSISLNTGINRATLRDWWLNGMERRDSRLDCPRCHDELPQPTDAYLYLLGLYLGDGCLSEAARTTALRISCADDWPGLMNLCATTIEKVSGRRTYRVAAQGCHEILGLWKHWPCLFPQHGRGPKHERLIVLEPWQQQLVRTDPHSLVRGLIHSDGCRITNWTEKTVGGTTKRYTYPRYFFTNVSEDIRGIFTDALDLMGIGWKQNRWNSISVARREAVAALDEFVGPKW
jgi:hypothetical protein